MPVAGHAHHRQCARDQLTELTQRRGREDAQPVFNGGDRRVDQLLHEMVELPSGVLATPHTAVKSRGLTRNRLNSSGAVRKEVDGRALLRIPLELKLGQTDLRG